LGLHGALTHLRFIIRKKTSGLKIVARNRMIRASGFAWVAREPKLMCGAKGRASSQRSIDYHIPSRPSKGKSGKEISTFTASFSAGREQALAFPP
jgi:hypothetical protein